MQVSFTACGFVPALFEKEGKDPMKFRSSFTLCGLILFVTLRVSRGEIFRDNASNAAERNTRTLLLVYCCELCSLILFTLTNE